MNERMQTDAVVNLEPIVSKTRGADGEWITTTSTQYEQLEKLAQQYEKGENVASMIITAYQWIKAIWDHSVRKGNFGNLSDDFYDALAAVELLIQKEGVVEKYETIFGEKPSPILK